MRRLPAGPFHPVTQEHRPAGREGGGQAAGGCHSSGRDRRTPCLGPFLPPLLRAPSPGLRAPQRNVGPFPKQNSKGLLAPAAWLAVHKPLPKEGSLVVPLLQPPGSQWNMLKTGPPPRPRPRGCSSLQPAKAWHAWGRQQRGVEVPEASCVSPEPFVKVTGAKEMSNLYINGAQGEITSPPPPFPPQRQALLLASCGYSCR